MSDVCSQCDSIEKYLIWMSELCVSVCSVFVKMRANICVNIRMRVVLHSFECLHKCWRAFSQRLNLHQYVHIYNWLTLGLHQLMVYAVAKPMLTNKNSSLIRIKYYSSCRNTAYTRTLCTLKWRALWNIKGQKTKTIQSLLTGAPCDSTLLCIHSSQYMRFFSTYTKISVFLIWLFVLFLYQFNTIT